MFQVCIEDALDHRTTVGEFETLEDAQVCYDECLRVGAEGYEIGVELEEVIGDYDDYHTHAYHEWFTLEEWEEAHPWNDNEGVWENTDG